MQEENKEHIENPLVVHKESDSSYQKSTDEYKMEETHIEDDGPTLERHRFKKPEDKKSNKGVWIILVIVVVAAVFCALYFTGNITFSPKTSTTKAQTQTTAQTTTTIEMAYKDTIVIKNTYIFVDGKEVDGIEGLQEALKYEEKSTTRYTLIDENADSSFLNDNVLPILLDLGFYGNDTVITHKSSTGLMAAEETTTKKAKTKKKSSKTTEKNKKSKNTTTEKSEN